MPAYTRAFEEQISLYDWLHSVKGREENARYNGEDEFTLSVVDRGLRYGETYFWSEELCMLLETSAGDMPDWFLGLDLLPSENGFVWFERPLTLPLVLPDSIDRILEEAHKVLESSHQNTTRMNELTRKVTELNKRGIRPTTTEAIALLNEADAQDNVSAEVHTNLLRYRKELDDIWIDIGDKREPGLVAFTWTCSTVRGKDTAEFVFYTNASVRPRGFPVDGWDWGANEGLEQQLDEVGKSAAKNPTRRATCIRYVAAALAFVNQDLLARTYEQPDRATRRRAPEWRPEPLIQVVKLRKVKRPHGAVPMTAEEEMEWSCRWLVRGHWRQQWYSKMQRHQAIWIAPFVKGPEDKPLKPPRSRVFAVIR